MSGSPDGHDHGRKPPSVINPDYIGMVKATIEQLRSDERAKAEHEIASIWRLDLKTIALIATILIGMAGNAFMVGGWVSGVSSRQSQDEAAVATLKLSSEATAATLKDRIDRIETERIMGLQRLSAVEQVAKDVETQLLAISTKLDRVSERMQFGKNVPFEK